MSRRWPAAVLAAALAIVLVPLAVHTRAGAATARTAAAVTPLVGQHRTLPGGRTYWLSGTGSTLVVGLPGSNLPATNVNDVFWQTGNPATTGWQRHAAAHGYTLALGEPADPAHGSSWNVGGGWPSGPQDDMAYLLAVVADAGTFDRVFIAGFSAGGAMAWRATAEHPEVFAACGSGSGWAPLYPAGPIDCWHTHGTGDTTVPVRGGFVSIFPYSFPAAFEEAARAPRGSRVVLEVSTGGHAVPGWMADRLWWFWTVGRMAP